MNEKAYQIAYRILLFTMLMVLLHAAWKWGAPWFMSGTIRKIGLATQKNCEKTHGCLRVQTPRPRWFADKGFHCPAYLIVVSKKMPKNAETELINAVWRHSTENPGLLYRAWVQKPCVWVNHE